MIKKMKKGKTLTVQAINMQGRAISLPLPLNDFAKAFDGPPTDPKVFEERQRKLQEELQKKAEAARKKLEAQKPGAEEEVTRVACFANEKRRGLRARAFFIAGHPGARRARARDDGNLIELAMARTVAAAVVPLEDSVTCGWRIGSPEVSGSRFCSET